MERGARGWGIQFQSNRWPYGSMCSAAALLLACLALPTVLCWEKQDANITTIYLISSCHLDVGFANTEANIVNEYFDKYFPAAIKNAQDLRKLGGKERLVFTTHPFLVHLYYNCYPALGLHCPSQVQLEDFTAAINRGDIVWHAFPFNAQMEFYDSSLADFGFRMTHELDKKFGRNATMTMSQRDVPGTTRSLIPIMVRNGVKAITVGVNTGSMPPAVPTVFTWNDPLSGSKVIGMWHPHGYGGQPGPSLKDMVIVPGLKEALAFAIRGDNSGPPSVLEVIKNYAVLKLLFPNAEIIASGYDAFVEKLLTVQLPVYSNEIGDTWIHGVASDPFKTAKTREMMRQRRTCISKGLCKEDDQVLNAFSALLLKNGEHTWGKDVKTYLHDITHWSNSQFHSEMSKSNFEDMVKSWVEQRNWGLDYPLHEILGDNHPLSSMIQEGIKELVFDGHISTDTFKQIDISSKTKCGSFEIGFSSTTGAINHLEYIQQTGSPLVFATEDNPIAQIIYQTYTADDYKTFLDEYVYDFIDPIVYLDLGKPGLGLIKTEKFNVSPLPKSLWFQEKEDSCVFLLENNFDAKLVLDYGAPQSLWIEVEILKYKGPLANMLNFTVYLVNKTSTRIPESLSVYMNPSGVDPTSMEVSKLGEYVNALDVLTNGSKHLHAVDDDGVAYNSTKVVFQSYDTSLVCIGYPTPFPVPMEQPNVSKGFAFNIFNNIWGTNYIMWYPYLLEEKSTKYRFMLKLND